jgi:SAM-dependent methyltransferase
MDFSQFDTRQYPTRSARDGYGEWAASYEDTVLDVMDIRLLARLQSVQWNQCEKVADLACGTGRIGVWLKGQGVSSIDGLDLTAEMLAHARDKNAYRQLMVGNILEIPLKADTYDLVTAVLVDEHLPTVQALYQETARITCPGGYFVLVGYHPFFLMNGMPTHFNSATGEPISIQCYVHLFSDHVQAALAAEWRLIEIHEGLIDDEFLAHKPKWTQHRNRPFSFVMVWQKSGK